jgi:hypothetical protein
MLRRLRVLPFLACIVTCLAIAGPKKKNLLPASVLSAHTVLVLIDPQAGTSLDAPLANKTAQEDVEKALMKWGRLTPVMETQTADLLIIVRKGSGKLVQPTVGGLPTNNRPVVGEASDTDIRVGAQQGHPLPQDGPASGPDPTQSQETKPHPQADVGAADDMFVVYQGHVDRPLDQPSLWRYSATDALHSPDVPAVEKFRKAVEEAEKQQKGKP